MTGGSEGSGAPRTGQLPSGTVTFLFTDIEGSTKLLRELGTAYAEALAKHRRRLREAFAAHGGVEVDTQGDAFFVAFARPSDAIAAAEAGQRELAGGPIRVRMGIHTGVATVTAEGYVGLDVHRAARICAAANGGQVVVGASTAGLLDGGDLRALGSHRLKDLSEPQQLYQLGQEEHLPLRTLHQSNLPIQATRLIGREEESVAARALLAEHRLVTLVGPGGVGKTRLAMQIAAESVDDFAGGIWWVSLAPVRDVTLVLPTIAQAIGAQVELAEHIGDRSLLFLLDNLEQAIESAPELAGLLATCPGLRLLVTSREPLRVAGEVELELAPLPPADAAILFWERAQAVRPGLRADEDVDELCRRLDCLPLALELAAARVKVLSPAAMLERLERRLPLLTGGGRDAPERQRTLRATIEWSYDLLEPGEQQLLGRLSIFSSWDVEAAEAVAGAHLETLAPLVDKSLVRVSGERFFMLETIREFAQERLAEAGELRAYGRRHAEYYVALAEEVERLMTREGGGISVARLRAEHSNLRAALAWAGVHDPDLGLRLVSALRLYWLDRELVAEGDRWFTALLRTDRVSPVYARALGAAAMLAGLRGDAARALPLLIRSLALSRQLEDGVGIAWAQIGLATGALQIGAPAAARPWLEEALRLHLEGGNKLGTARTLHLLGLQAHAVGEYERGRQLVRQSIDVWQEMSEEFGLAAALHSLGDLELEAGEIGHAEDAYRDAISRAHALDAPRLVCYCLAGLSATAAERGNAPRSVRLWKVAVALEQDLQFHLRKRGMYESRVAALSEPEGTHEKAPVGLGEAVAYALEAEDGVDGARPSALDRT